MTTLADRWLVPALGVAQICSWGALFYSFPLIATAMERDLGWSRPELYGAASVGLLAAGLAAYPVGLAIDRGLGRWVMGGASVLCGLLLVAWSAVDHLGAFYAILALIGMLQAATLYEPAFAVIARRVGPVQARRGITALTLWAGFSSTLFIPLVEAMLGWWGWRGTLVALGAVMVVISGGINATVIDPALDRGADPRRAAPPRRGVVAAAVRLPVFWALMTAYAAYAGTFFALSYHLYPLLLERGLAAASVVTVLALIGPAQVVGRLVVWRWFDVVPVRRVGGVVVVVFPLAVVGFGFAPAQLAILAGVAVCYGAANGVMTIVRGYAVPELVSRTGYGALNGVLGGPAYVVQALAPIAVALLWSGGPDYRPAVLAVGALATIMVLSFWAAAVLRVVEDPEAPLDPAGGESGHG